MSKHKPTSPHTSEANELLLSYTVGFVLSVLLTGVAYFAVVEKLLNGWGLVYFVIALALLQAAVQLTFLLDLGKETKPRLKAGTLAFMMLVAFIICGGSLWIMHNLNYRMMDASQMEHYMDEQVGL